MNYAFRYDDFNPNQKEIKFIDGMCFDLFDGLKESKNRQENGHHLSLSVQKISYRLSQAHSPFESLWLILLLFPEKFLPTKLI